MYKFCQDGQGDGLSLIHRLAQLTVNQSGVSLETIDPSTGAAASCNIEKDNVQQKNEAKAAKTAKNILVGGEVSKFEYFLDLK